MDSTPELEQTVARTLKEAYGIDAVLSRLPGENLNYLAECSTGEKYIVKLAAKDQSEQFVEMEKLALECVSRELKGVQFPLIIENKFGNAETSVNFGRNVVKRLRLMNYLSGKSLEDSDISDATRKNVGKFLAKFDLAMESFDHPAAHRPHRWDLVNAAQHEGSIQWLKSPKKKALLSWAFAQHMKINSGINNVAWQFIHGDANPENLLVDRNKVVGLVDFGDSCFNPRICELAICLPYLMMDQADPMAVAQVVIDGYKSVIPLTDTEMELLWPLVLGRLATTISVATERRQKNPNHPNWFVSEKRAWSLLVMLQNTRNVFV